MLLWVGGVQQARASCEPPAVTASAVTEGDEGVVSSTWTGSRLALTVGRLWKDKGQGPAATRETVEMGRAGGPPASEQCGQPP